jgi:trimeric autotransporter adhesin
MSSRLLKALAGVVLVVGLLEFALPAAGAPRPLKGSATLVQVLRTVNAVLGMSKQANANATKALKLAKSPSIGSANIRAKSVQTSDLADGAVTGAQLAAGVVTPDKLAAGIPDNLLATIATAGKIANSALPQITSANIADGTVTSTDIADGTVGSADIADGSVTSSDIADGTIADADVGSLSANKISGGSFTNAVLGSGGTAITKHVAATNVLPAGLTGPLAASTCSNLGTVTVAGVAPTDTGDVVTATPIKSTQGTASGIEALSLSWNAYVSGANTVTIRVCNLSGSSISIGTGSGNLDSTQHWAVSVTQH